MTSSRTLLAGLANGVMAGALWGIVFLVPRLLQDFSPLQMAAGRYILYGILSCVMLAPRWKMISQQVNQEEWRALFWLSLLGNLIYYVFLAAAVPLIGGPATSLIIGFLPITVLLCASRDQDSMPLRHVGAPVLLSVLGIVLIVCGSWLHTSASSSSPTPSSMWDYALGILCAVGALASWTAYSVMNSRWLRRRPHISGHDWSLLTGVVTGAQALALGLPAFFYPGSAGYPPHAGMDWLRFWTICGGVAIFSSIIGNGFWNRAARLLPLSLSGQMIVFETLFALLYSFLWEHRWPTGTETFAMIFLVTGVLWCMAAHRKQA
ncbi:DMT family transporter [Acetobacter tropicalis]|uniref:Integral membrane protein n=1 Tax=Acetobacter tropicalis TaxID=104102 RepID=A0A094Z182_9PROT|nr:DMT family transporter [Acetobacter tropicalis]KAA8390982.1 DMT family transporter [Acetobacter tropicalis]KAA8392584.1 DMT family transporter [Acetobacter tropicalis]KGB26689.1 integral membrane protein [Acetobacter tropicalis]MBC9009186.1 DMT family transporter [Acetobacter tropicalis]MDO8171862.1 DMT family transporter [Acetobacter tropicalis]